MRGLYPAVLAAVAGFMLAPSTMAQDAPRAPDHSVRETAQLDRPDRTRSAAQGATVLAVTPDRLVGRPVRTREGDIAGIVGYLMVDVRTGDLSHLIVEERGGSFVAVPWSALDVAPRPLSLVLREPAAALGDALRPDRSDLERLASPSAYARVLSDLRAPQTGESASGSGAAAAEGGGAVWRRLIQRNAVFVLSPVFTAARAQILSAPILDSGGARIGEISDVMLDLTNGRVAYVLVESQGALGAGSWTWTPVPMRALSWAVEDQGLVATLDADLASVPPPVPGDAALPAPVPVEALDALYARYGVAPYRPSRSAR